MLSAANVTGGVKGGPASLVSFRACLPQPPVVRQVIVRLLVAVGVITERRLVEARSRSSSTSCPTQTLLPCSPAWAKFVIAA